MENQNHKLVRNYLICTLLIWVIHCCFVVFFRPSVAAASEANASSTTTNAANESETARRAKEWGQSTAAAANLKLNSYTSMDNNQLKALISTHE